MRESVRSSMADQVFQEIRQAILGGELTGELNQVEISNRLGVSRAPVREALRRLEEQGLVEHRSFRRAVVADLSPRTLEEMYEVRIALEGLAVVHATPRIDPATLRRLERLVAKMGAAEDHRAWLKQNVRFHETLYAPCGNAFLLKQIEAIRLNTERYLYHHETSVVRPQEANPQHRALLEAVAKGDAELARIELSAHLASTLKALLAGLETAEDTARREA